VQGPGGVSRRAPFVCAAAATAPRVRPCQATVEIERGAVATHDVIVDER
jgi:hypothetical protein